MANPVVTIVAGSTPTMTVVQGAAPVVTVDVTSCRGFYLYVNRVAGAGESLTKIAMTYTIIDTNNVSDPTGVYDMVEIGAPNTLASCELLLTSLKQVFYIPKQSPGATMKLTFTYTGTVGTSATLSLFAKAKSLY